MRPGRHRSGPAAGGLAIVVAAALLGWSVIAPTAAAAAPFDCKQAPTPEMPGRGLAGFFAPGPAELPPPGDPFAETATTTIYEQYGYAGLRWHTYDLGCGPDAARSPDAVVGTAIANWLYQLPVTAAAATDAVVGVAFEPTFLGTFDPLILNVVQTLHDRVFTRWVPLVLAGLGLLLVLRSRRASLASGTAALGWALLVLVVTAALFRWPLEAGRFADASAAATLGEVSGGLTDADASAGASPAVRSASNVHEALLYRTWLAGAFGQSNSDVARRYGPEIFDAQALTWREARAMRDDPERGRQIIEAKRARFAQAAARVADEDPDAYEYLVGRRSDSRVGYAVLAGFGVLCALPFLLVSSLLLLGAFLVVRFAVMLFPAFATLGVFPAARGLVVGIGTTVAAALLNGTIFGIAAAVTVRAIGLILDPRSALPHWLALVVMLLVSVVLWVATRPFRRLTTMVPAGHGVFGDAAGALGGTARRGGRWARLAGGAALASYTGNRIATGLTARPDDLEADAGPGADTPRTETRPGRAPEVDPLPDQPPTLPPVPPRSSLPDPVEPDLLDGEDGPQIYRPARRRSPGEG